MAKLAVTPPVVGSVRIETNGRPARSSRASAADTLAICMSDSAPSIMRAPPEHETTSSGCRRSSAISTARVIFSPTTTPMLPPMKAYSMAATTTSRPSRRPVATITASLRPVALIVAEAGRDILRVVMNGSFEVRSEKGSTQSSSNSAAQRSAGAIENGRALRARRGGLFKALCTGFGGNRGIDPAPSGKRLGSGRGETSASGLLEQGGHQTER